MKKLILPALSVALCFGAFITFAKVGPYWVGTITPVSEAGGEIPSNVWLRAGMDLLEILSLIGVFYCNGWLCSRVFSMLDERREKRKKHDKGI